MFCSECGTKNQDGAKFCENCGTELEVEETVVPKKENTSKEVKKEPKTKTISKKQKVLGVLFIVLVVGLFGVYKVLDSKTNPTAVANSYIEAIDNKDYKTLYELSEFSGDTAFITEENFKSVIDENFEKKKFTNYIINKTPTYTNNNLKATVSVSFAGTSTGASDTTIVLTKEKGKKFLFFDSWKIDDTSYLLGYEVVKDFEIKVPKGSKVKYDGVEISDKYIVTTNDNKKEANTVDVYKLPQVFERDNVKVEAVLPYGVSLSDEVNISSYRTSYKFEFDDDDFSDELKASIKNNLQAQMSELENGLISGKSFNDQKKLFSTEMDLKELEEKYEATVKKISNASYTNSNFNITELKLADLSCYNDDYTIVASISIDYTCQRTDKTTGSTEDEKNTWYVAAYLNYEDNEFKIFDLSDVSYSYWW